jgi:hypothetical protein
VLGVGFGELPEQEAANTTRAAPPPASHRVLVRPGICISALSLVRDEKGVDPMFAVDPRNVRPR